MLKPTLHASEILGNKTSRLGGLICLVVLILTLSG